MHRGKAEANGFEEVFVPEEEEKRYMVFKEKGYVNLFYTNNTTM